MPSSTDGPISAGGRSSRGSRSSILSRRRPTAVCGVRGSSRRSRDRHTGIARRAVVRLVVAPNDPPVTVPTMAFADRGHRFRATSAEGFVRTHHTRRRWSGTATGRYRVPPSAESTERVPDWSQSALPHLAAVGLLSSRERSPTFSDFAPSWRASAISPWSHTTRQTSPGSRRPRDGAVGPGDRWYDLHCRGSVRVARA